MRTTVLVAPKDRSETSVDRLQDLLVLLVDHGGEQWTENDWRLRLPAWLVDAFAPTRTREEKLEWLARWRNASATEQSDMEHASGWELPEWLHWFTPKNDYWRLFGIRKVDGKLQIEIDHADEPFPMGVLEWTVGVARLNLEAIERIE